MNQSLYIKLKAAFLLITFSLNVFVGFACAVGADMGFNAGHHDEEATEVHSQTHADKQHHEEAEHKHSHKDGKDDCCNDKVLKIGQSDKVVPQVAKMLAPVFSAKYLAVSYNANLRYPSQVNTANKYFVRGHHPPIPDIRIAIRSFQI